MDASGIAQRGDKDVYPDSFIANPGTGLPKVDLQLTAWRCLKPDCCPLLRFEFAPPFPDPKLDRAQTDDNSMLADQLLPDHIGIAVVAEEAFAQPIVQAIESSAANRLLEWRCSALPQISPDSVASTAKLFR